MRRLLPLLAAVSTLAACGGTGGASPPSGDTANSPTTAAAVGQSLVAVVVAPGAANFDRATYRAPAGKVAIGMRNLSAVRRNIAIRGHGVDAHGPVAGKGQTSVVSASLKPGTYVLSSSPGGRDQPAMHARLIVAG